MEQSHQPSRPTSNRHKSTSHHTLSDWISDDATTYVDSTPWHGSLQSQHRPHSRPWHGPSHIQNRPRQRSKPVQVTWNGDVNISKQIFIQVLPPTLLGKIHMMQGTKALQPGYDAWNGSAYSRDAPQQSYARHEGLVDDELADLALALSLVEEDEQRQESPLVEDKTRSRSRTGRGLVNFKKTWMYANSRLPPYMPPMIMYTTTWRLLCLAAQASLNVYNRPRGDEREHFVDASWQHSTKAMVLKSRPVDDKEVIVFAIRGSQLSFIDWSINFRPTPTSPEGFLDDAGNACHAGFLTVAKAMIRPVAARLRQLLEQKPSRSRSSLVITGHSAGGAVAALLYAHMLSETVRSELRDLTSCFKRVHCFTFGTPPLSLLPLQTPSHAMSRKSMFMSFVNEGDPVARAERAYVVSLAKVLAAPAPQVDGTVSKILKGIPSRLVSGSKSRPAPYWPLPESTLSSVGRIIVIRNRADSSQRLEAVSSSDEQLRDMLFGDPAMHSMALYQSRIEQLAFAAITGADE